MSLHLLNIHALRDCLDIFKRNSVKFMIVLHTSYSCISCIFSCLKNEFQCKCELSLNRMRGGAALTGVYAQQTAVQATRVACLMVQNSGKQNTILFCKLRFHQWLNCLCLTVRRVSFFPKYSKWKISSIEMN